MSREADLYKDKIEVSLDGRQIFYLFFGGAVIVGLVFVLGVMVGRRVEARGHVDRARTTAAVDPLAALDRLEDKGGGLSFKGSLMGTPAASDVEQQIGAIEKARAKAKDEPKKATDEKSHVVAEVKKVATDEVKKVATDEPKKGATDEPKKVEAKKVEAKKVATDEPKKVATDEKKDVVAEGKKLAADEPKKKAATDEPKKVATDEAKKVATDEAKKVDEPKKVEKKSDVVAEVKADEAPKSKYTLQLSSFQDKAEADAFLSSIKAQGYQAHVTEATVTGKGTFYRVRMGSYKSIEAANDAKAEFEKASKKSASVMKL